MKSNAGGLGANSGMPMLSLQENSGLLLDQFQTAVGETTAWASSAWTTWGISASSFGDEANMPADVVAAASSPYASLRRTALSSRSRSFVPTEMEQTARKPAARPLMSPPKSSQETLRQLLASVLKADLLASPSVPLKENLPVKFTFIHYDEVDREEENSSADDMTPLNSAPGVLCSVPFCEKLTLMERNHISGICKPCAYFQEKEDGCRRGDACSFCHICPSGQLKKQKRAKKRALRVLIGKEWWNNSAYAPY